MKALLPVLLLLIPTSLSAAVVAGFEFNGATTEGFTANNVSGFSTSTGDAVGTASSNDPQLILNPTSLTPTPGETWTTIEVRVRELDSNSGLFIGSAGAPALSTVGTILQVNALLRNGNVAGQITASASGDDYYTLTADISSLGATTITNIRVDPIGGALSNSGSNTSGNSFEVDYIRISDTAVIPEPSSALLIGFAGLIFLRRRR